MSLDLQSVRAEQRKNCGLCSELVLMDRMHVRARMRRNHNVRNHSHKCVICGWAIEDISDGVSISWDTKPGSKILLTKTGGIPETIQDNFLNGYWTHRYCLERI